MSTEVTPEQGPNSGASPPPDKEPKPNGVRFRIESPDRIFEALKKGFSGEVGRFLLPNPVPEVGVTLNARDGNFDLDVEVCIDRLVIKSQLIELIRQGIAASNNPAIQNLEEIGGNFIVTTSSGIKFVVNQDTILSRILITTGLMKSKITGKLERLFDPPLLDRETYDNVMASFTEVFQAVVEEIYKVYNADIPNKELVIQPPTEDAIELGVKSEKLAEAESELLRRIEIKNPNVSFEDIGGLDEAVEQMKLVVAAIENPESFTRWGARPPKGVLLIGPPGTGKTLLAKALATEAGARFLHIQASDIFTMWYGESGKKLEAIFELARSLNEKVIIFIDEIDAIFTNREGVGVHEETQRVIGILLQKLDGIRSKDMDNITIVAATNRPEAIDPALRRPGRFDREIIVPLPKEKERGKIFKIHMEKAEALAGRELFNIDNLDKIVRRTEGFSGADIAEIIRRVLEERVRQEINGLQPGEVTKEDIIREIERFERRTEQKRPIGFRTDSYERSKND